MVELQAHPSSLVQQEKPRFTWPTYRKGFAHEIKGSFSDLVNLNFLLIYKQVNWSMRIFLKELENLEASATKAEIHCFSKMFQR